MKPTTRNVLDRLRVAPATTHDLCQPEVGGIRFGGRIKELRDLGYVIDRKRVREGSHLYTLIAEPEEGGMPNHTDKRSVARPVSQRGRDRQVMGAGSASAMNISGTHIGMPGREHGGYVTGQPLTSSPANPPAGASANGAQGDPATAHETADMPAPPDSPLVARAETSYTEFLQSKATIAPATGFHVDVDQISEVLKPHQRKIVQWAVAGGRRALFESFGLGKTIQQLEILRLILDHGPLNGRGLIVCPLGVHQEFEHDARLLGIEDRLHRVKTTEQAQQLPAGSIALTNYEPVRDGKLDPNVFTVASLDEAAILRSFGSKTYQGFLTLFEQVPYRFVATATPSPNRYKELIHYGAFLGIMDSGQALTRFFKRDSTQANNLTLLETQERNFWLWLASWSVWLQEPSELCDCGCHATAVNGSCPFCECAAYQLPQLDIQQHRLEVDHLAETNLDSWGQTILLRDSARSIQEAAKEKRRTLDDRVWRMLELITEQQAEDPGAQVILFCHLNDEQRAIEKALTAAAVSWSSIEGSMSLEDQERELAKWRAGETTALIGKPVMLGVGLNLQQCHREIFVGIDHKFHDTIQAVHRIHRFGQQHPCRVDLIFAESEQHIADNLLAKWSQHVELTGTMRDLLSEHGLSGLSIETALTRSLGVDRDEAAGDGWRLVRNDCIPETESMEENSVGLIVTSIPFNTQYEYSAATEDLGFNDDVAAFWEQMDYLTPQLLRVLQPGRLYCCHVKDRILFGNVTGAGLPTVLPFHAQAIDHGMRHGFDYLGMVTVVTDVVRENNQTYRLGWSENAKDGTKMGVGSPEYVLLFHKPQTDRSRGYADVPVLHPKDEYTRARWQVDAHAFWRSSGNRLLFVDELAAMGPDVLASEFTRQSMQQVYDYEDHVRIGEALEARGKLPSSFMSLAPGSNDPMVWHDVNRMLTLNGEQKARNLTLHICPLQIDIVDRLIRRFSNEGDVVFDPFAGLGTVPLQALKMARRGLGVELNADYWRDSVGYLKAEEAKRDVPTLFDMLDASAAAA